MADLVVLIVDDCPQDIKDLTQTIRTAYEDSGCRMDIKSASTTAELYEALAKRRFDLVFMDVSFSAEGGSDSEGLDAIRVLGSHYPDLPVIIVTGHYGDKIKEVVREFWGETTVCDILDKGTYTHNDVWYAIERARSQRETTVPTDVVANTESSDTRSNIALRLLAEVLSAVAAPLELSQSAAEDLLALWGRDAARFCKAVKLIVQLSTLQLPSEGSRDIESMPGVWEKHVGDFRVYFTAQEPPRLLRITAKGEQKATIRWLRKSYCQLPLGLPQR